MKLKYFILAVVLLQSISFSQQLKPANSDDDKGWFSLGFGVGNDHKIASVLSANFGREKFIQIVHHANFTLPGISNGVSSLAVGCGISHVTDFTRMALSIGPAYVYGKESGPDNVWFNTAGILTNLHVIASPFKEIGIGIDLFLNLNFKKNNAGISITFIIEGNK